MALLTTALVSASVAALVTVIIEWTVKPHLEARKDRVVEGSRIKRQLDPWKVTYALQAQEEEQAEDAHSDRDESLSYIEEVRAFMELLDEAEQVLVTRKDLRAVRCASQILRFHHAFRTNEDSFLWKKGFHGALDALRTPAWRMRKRRRLLKAPKAIVNMIERSMKEVEPETLSQGSRF